MTFLDIVIIVVIVLAVLGGYRKGLVLTAFNFVAFFLAWVLVKALHPVVYDFIIGTPLYISLKENIIDRMDISSQVNELTAGAWESFLAGLPFPIQMAPPADTSNLIDVSSFEQSIASAIVGIIIHIISLVVLFLIVLFIIMFLAKSLNIINKIPIIGALNRNLGAIAGLVWGVILSWVMLIFYSFIFISPDSGGMDALNDSTVALWLYERNILLNIIVELFAYY